MSRILALLNMTNGADFVADTKHDFRFHSHKLGMTIDAWDTKKQTWMVVGTDHRGNGFENLIAFVKAEKTARKKAQLPDGVSWLTIKVIIKCCESPALDRTERIKDLISKINMPEADIAASSRIEIAAILEKRLSGGEVSL